MRQPKNKRPQHDAEEKPQRRRTLDRIKNFDVTQENTLLEFLYEVFAGKSKTTVKSYLLHKQVAINGTPNSQYNAPLKAGDVVAVNFDQPFPVFSHPRMRIIYEDDAVIVVDKGYGLLSMSTDRIKENTAYHLLSDYVKLIHPANRIFILHRLDRDTSGVMMFAKSEEIQEMMQRNWYNVVTQRKYFAVVNGTPEKDRGEIRSYLTENSAFQVYSTENPNEGQLAITRYKVFKSNEEFSLVELELETGRKNQIRVHLKEMGHPIVGDRKYGADVSPIGRLALHASKLEFIHPITEEKMCFVVPAPDAFIKMVRKKTKPKQRG